MGQIVKRKKGRPSKADLARRASEPSSAPEIDGKRSLRRRNVRYNIDYDDYLEEEEFVKKKLIKLNQVSYRGRSDTRGGHARSDGGSGSEEEDDDESERKPLKKRRIDGVNDEDDDEDEEEIGRRVEPKEADSLPGTPAELPLGIPLPDKKKLELILDKLQKKDIYGVYAEPVDPEELPDYHDVIEHPMDFATVRKKLGKGTYTTLEQFESDVSLICSNAMQYNSSETIYHKQARSIQELARKKFHKLRVEYERTEKEVKSEQKSGSNLFAKKQVHNHLHRSSQELISSDFTSGATLAAAGYLHTSSIPTQASGCERPINDNRLVDNNSSLNEINLEKTEELSSGKGLSKFGRKLSVLDEDRRATYNISTQPVVGSESIFATFEGEIKQLVAVGLHAEYSYARSLARFAATIGPVAWRIASRRIQQALPADCKFGRGWVGEYEPPPTPVLVENHAQRESALAMRLRNCSAGQTRKEDEAFKTSLSPRDHHPVNRPAQERKSPFSAPASNPSLDKKPSLIAPTGTRPITPVHASYQQHNASPRSFTEPQNKVLKQADLNSQSVASQNNTNPFVQRQMSDTSETTGSRGRETIPRNMNVLQTNPFKQTQINGVVSGGLPNDKSTIPGSSNRMPSPSPDATPNQMARTATYFPRAQEQALTDPVQLMRMLAEKSHIQQTPSNQSPVETPPERLTGRREDSTNAASVTAHAWMSIGAASFKQPGQSFGSVHKDQISADSLYNPTRGMHPQLSRVRAEFPPGGMHFQPAITGFPLPNTMQQVRMGNEAELQSRPMIFPQFMSQTDLSRLQGEPSWQGLSPRSQPRQRQDMFPPDLNIGFPSPGSPARQQGVMVDSQQPDLALQL